MHFLPPLEIPARGNRLAEFSATVLEALRKATAGMKREWVKQVGDEGLDGKRNVVAARDLGALKQIVTQSNTRRELRYA